MLASTIWRFSFVRPTTATPGLNELKSRKGTGRMAIPTDSARQFAHLQQGDLHRMRTMPSDLG